VCGSPDQTFLFSLGEQYVSDFPEPFAEPSGGKVPIDLELCNYCSLVQAKHTARQDFLYTRHYWYRSGVTATMRAALGDVAADIEKLIELKADDVVLDIGSNDGTLLRAYTVDGVNLVGVEPATNLAAEGEVGLDYFINDFWSYPGYESVVGRQAKVITALGMFYDLEDPNEFIADVAKALADDGLFVAQLMCLRSMIDLGDVGNFAHEHLEFYSFASLEYLFGRHGLEIIDVAINDVNGQSYRIYATHANGSRQPKSGAEGRIEAIRKAESDLASSGVYLEFFDKLERNKRETVDFIEDAVANGKSVWVYGASTKGNVILQYYGLDCRLISGAAERSPEKWGRVTVGTHIPICSEKIAREEKPDYFLALPYTFIDEFVAREKEFLERGGRFIVPLPEMRVI
jgi:SAM-dependent methyltransferase